MGDERDDLTALMQWMQRAITAPDAARDGEALRAVLHSSPELEAPACLGVYQRAYHARLLAVFSVEYPALRQVLGGEVFTAFVADYLRHNPPRGHSVGQLAENFPRHLADTHPPVPASTAPDDSGLPHDWPHLVVDLAFFERTVAEVYDGPGSEEQSVLTASDVLALSDAQLLDARLTPSPALRLMEFRYPVHHVVRDVRRGRSPELPRPAPTYIVVCREDYRVTTDEHTAGAHVLLAHLTRGHSLAETLAGAQRVASREHREQLARWASTAYFLAFAQA